MLEILDLESGQLSLFYMRVFYWGYDPGGSNTVGEDTLLDGL